MAGPLLYFVVVGGSRIAYRYGAKKIAEQMAKRLGGKVTKTKPKGKTIKQGPSPSAPGSSPKLNQPQAAGSGKFQKPSPSPAPRRATQPKKPESPSSTSPARPKTDKTPATNTRKPSVPSKAPGGTRGRYTGGRGRKKPKTMDKSLVRERPNMPPKPKTSRPALLRDSARPAAPEIDKDSLKPVEQEKRSPSTRTSPKPPKKQEGPSKRGKPTKTKKVSPGSSPRPKLRPDTKTTKKTTKPKTDPLKGWSDSRRKALGSDKIGKDAGDGMVWIVMGNSNGLTRVKPSDPRVAEQKRLKKFL
jgi:hypothetical protein